MYYLVGILVAAIVIALILFVPRTSYGISTYHSGQTKGLKHRSDCIHRKKDSN